jgi:RNA polymerase sigma factor (sigma-70 family)
LITKAGLFRSAFLMRINVGGKILQIKKGCARVTFFVYNSRALKRKTEGSFLRDPQRELLELLDRSGASLYALLARITLREDIAEELMQELFIKLSNSTGPDKTGSWDAYARKAAINLAFDWRRRQKQSPRPLGKTYELASSDCSPLGKLIRAEEVQEVLSALSHLNGAYGDAFVMRYIQQDSYDYIAKQLGRTPHQARALCARAMSYIRDALRAYQPPSRGKGVQDVEN